MSAWLYLGIAIAAELIATSALRVSDGFTRVLPSAIAVAGYGVAFFLLSLALRHIAVGTAYAVWAGLGTVGIAMIGWLIFGERVTAWSAVGIAMIVGGVLVLRILAPTPH